MKKNYVDFTLKETARFFLSRYGCGSARKEEQFFVDYSDDGKTVYICEGHLISAIPKSQFFFDDSKGELRKVKIKSHMDFDIHDPELVSWSGSIIATCSKKALVTYISLISGERAYFNLSLFKRFFGNVRDYVFYAQSPISPIYIFAGNTKQLCGIILPINPHSIVVAA